MTTKYRVQYTGGRSANTPLYDSRAAAESILAATPTLALEIVEVATPTKTRTITLTGRPPVRIVEADWPAIAEAKDDSAGDDYSRRQQKLHQGEADEWGIKVRQHADGRTVVYGWMSAAIAAWHQPAGGQSAKGGYVLVPAGDGPLAPDDGRTVEDAAIVAAIQRVASECGIPAATAHACIADLPAEDL